MMDDNRRKPSSKQPCGKKGCANTATENKPFCIDHLEQFGHAAKLSSSLAERDEEELKAASRLGWKKIDVRGSRAQEIVEVLIASGAQTPKRLAIMVDIRPEALAGYLKALERAKILRVLTLGSRRGTPRTVVALRERIAS